MPLVNVKPVTVAEAERKLSAVTGPLSNEIVADVERKLLEISWVRKVTIPLILEKVDEVERSPLFVSSFPMVTLPPEVVIVEVPDNPPPAVTQNGKLFTDIAEEVLTEPPPPADPAIV